MARTKSARKPAARRAATPNASAKRASVFAWSLGGVALAAGAGLVAFLTRGRIAALLSGAVEGHVPTDLLDPDHSVDDRAIPAFRPDMSAPMTAGERAALAPGSGPALSLVADRGTRRAETASN